MNIVTIMNYDWSNKNNLAMCYRWIEQADLWLESEDYCLIFSSCHLPKILLDRMDASKKCKFKNCIREGFDRPVIFPAGSSKYKGENFTYKLYVLCHINFPFLFIDSDAFIVSTLNKLKNINIDRPILAIDHENIQDITSSHPPFINSGVLLIDDPNKDIMNWDKLYAYSKKCGFVFRFKNTKQIIPGTDQSVLKSYFDLIDYDYSNPQFNYSYNTCSLEVDFTKDQNGNWQAMKNGNQIHIVHYWDKFKPWKIKCPIFQETIDDKMFNSASFLV